MKTSPEIASEIYLRKTRLSVHLGGFETDALVGSSDPVFDAVAAGIESSCVTPDWDSCHFNYIEPAMKHSMTKWTKENNRFKRPVSKRGRIRKGFDEVECLECRAMFLPRERPREDGTGRLRYCTKACAKAAVERGKRESNLKRFGIEYKGERLLSGDWALRFGINKTQLQWRRQHGWTMEEIEAGQRAA